MGTNRLYELLKKYREQRCTLDEINQLNRWYGEFGDEAEQIPMVSTEKLEILFHQIENQIAQSSIRKTRKKLYYYLSGVAASLILLLAGSLYFTQDYFSDIRHKSLCQAFSIQPGGPLAELQLSDGSKVSLNQVAVIHNKQGGVIKNDSALLDYRSVIHTGKSEYNTISVPLGGEYGLILADGTRVWMNSGSTLKYPVFFEGDKREVYLTGEAYFSVTKSGVPFIVKTEDIDVKVLGTAFNISAYTTDRYVQTTLVHGSVVVKNNHDDQEYKLIPGNMLSYEKTKKQMSLEIIDTDLYTSWMYGEFKFRDMRLEEIINKLNRWYNCQVIYQDNTLKDLRFSGAAERDRTADYLLGLIEMVTNVTFQMEGKVIVVKRNIKK